MVKITWTKIAKQDLQEIYEYIALNSEHYANITVSKIYDNVQTLNPNPKIGRYVPELNSKNIRELILGNYRIIYRLNTSTAVEILRIYHSARLLKI